MDFQNVLFQGKQEVSKVCISAVMCVSVTTAAASTTTTTTAAAAAIKGDFSTLTC